ncbi:MAG: MotA/TolQ/ExbB proton channel family protein [Desulfobulbaceae bacterium]|nr:MAG: MotA/TolQ/ExbB proton channel family protein [Desulfobulbaceae bacterium]
MWPLLVCSLIVLTVIIERIIFWGQLEARRDRVLLDTVLYLAEHGKWDEIRKVTEENRDHVIRVLVVGIMHRDYDMGPAMEAEAELILRRMNRFMPALDTMITIAPLLGILGTVLGIISSFEMLGAAGIADPKLVTSGIAQALITTATGLIISIVAVVPYNYLNTRIDQAAHTIEKYATSLEVVFKKLSNGSDRP